MIKVFDGPHLEKRYFKIVLAFSENLNLPHELNRTMWKLQAAQSQQKK